MSTPANNSDPNQLSSDDSKRPKQPKVTHSTESHDPSSAAERTEPSKTAQSQSTDAAQTNQPQTTPTDAAQTRPTWVNRWFVLPERLLLWSELSLVLLSVIVVTGALVRLTGSGLGCTTWPGCTETQVLPPLSAHGLIEFGNRMFSAVVGLAALVTCWFAYRAKQRRKDHMVLASAVLAGVIAQAIIGMVTVHQILHPGWVMTHFFLSMLLIWGALVLAHRVNQPDSLPHAIVHADYVWFGRVVVALAAVVIFVGTVVTGSGPHGGDPEAPRLDLSFENMARVHAVMVWLLILVTVVLVVQLRRADASSTLLRRGYWLLGSYGVQGIIGYVQFAINMPAAMVAFHIAGSVMVWLAVLWFYLGMHERYGEIDLAVFDDGSDGVPLSLDSLDDSGNPPNG